MSHFFRRLSASHFLIGWLLFCVLVPTLCSAEMVTLAFDSLPSAQGFTYNNSGNPVPETDIFSVNGSALVQNSLGQTFSSPSSNFYSLNGVVNDSDPYSLAVRARVIADEVPGGGTDGTGFFVSVRSSTFRVNVSFGTNTINFSNGVFSTTAVDTTVVHDYRIEGIPASSTFNFFVDDVLIATPNVLGGVGQNYIGLGDPTGGGGNAQVEITEYSFTQVPEPASLFTVSFAFVLVLLQRPIKCRRRHDNTCL